MYVDTPVQQGLERVSVPASGSESNGLYQNVLILDRNVDRGWKVWDETTVGIGSETAVLSEEPGHDVRPAQAGRGAQIECGPVGEQQLRQLVLLMPHSRPQEIPPALVGIGSRIEEQAQQFVLDAQPPGLAAVMDERKRSDGVDGDGVRIGSRIEQQLRHAHHVALQLTSMQRLPGQQVKQRCAAETGVLVVGIQVPPCAGEAGMFCEQVGKAVVSPESTACTAS